MYHLLKTLSATCTTFVLLSVSLRQTLEFEFSLRNLKPSDSWPAGGAVLTNPNEPAESNLPAMLGQHSVYSFTA